MVRRAAVWLYFNESKQSKSVACKKCGKKYTMPAATETLRYHMLHAHCIDVPKQQSGRKRRRVDSEDADDVEEVDLSGAAGEASSSAGSESSSTSCASSTPAPPTVPFEGPMDRALAAAVGFAAGGIRKKKADDALIFMLAHDDMPLRSTEKEGLREYSKALQPLYTLPSEPTVTRGLEEKYETLRQRVGRRISKAEHLSLAVDLWTHESTMQGYLGLTVHFREGSKVVSIETGVKPMPKRKTAANIQAAIQEICREWQIDRSKVRAVVTDGGGNVKKAVRDEFGADKHINCAAHLLNSIGQAAVGLEARKPPSEEAPEDVLIIPEDELEAEALLEVVTDEDPSEDVTSLRTLLMKVKRIVRFFRSSDVATMELKAIQMERGKAAEEVLRLIQEVRTRWNSCYYMLDRFLELSEEVSIVLLKLQREKGSKQKPPAIINGHELKVLEEVRDLLKPLEEATRSVSSSMTISGVIPMVYGLNQDITAFQPSCRLTDKLKEKLLDEIKIKFSGVEYLRPLAAATMLDPRYKKYLFENTTAVGVISRYLTGRITDKLAERRRSREEETARQPESAKGGIWAAIDSRLQRSVTGRSELEQAGGQLPPQLKASNTNPVVDRATNPNPIATWLTMRAGLDHVFELAMEFLPIPASSTSAERLFSHAGCIATQRRGRISPTHLDMLTFLRSVPKHDWFA